MEFKNSEIFESVCEECKSVIEDNDKQLREELGLEVAEAQDCGCEKPRRRHHHCRPKCDGGWICKILGYKIVYHTLKFEDAVADFIEVYNKILCCLLMKGEICKLLCALYLLDEILEQMCCLQKQFVKSLELGLEAGECIDGE